LALASVTTRFTPLVMGLGNIFGKTHITERSASTRITVVVVHLVEFGVSYLYFHKGGTMKKIIGGEKQDSVKRYNGGNK
jgi:hypothetical protein